jgi:hypothetical protein
MKRYFVDRTPSYSGCAAYSNAEEVELLRNGQSQGRQTMAPFSELKWKVKYAPGALTARAFRGGTVVAETKVETTGAPAAVRLLPDRLALNADGEDLAVVTVAVVDAQGRVVPTADVPVAFTVAGPGRAIGVGNGDPTSHQPDVFVATQSIAPVRSTAGAGRRSPTPMPRPSPRRRPVSTTPPGRPRTSAARAAPLAWASAGFSARPSRSPLPSWSRCTFNGLAQVIVQTTKQPGTLQLSARAEGLPPATIPLTVVATPPRPSVE